MRKHIFGLAIFALISGSSVFAYRLIYSLTKTVSVSAPQQLEPSRSGLYTVDAYTITPSSVVVDVNSKKVYAGIGDKSPQLSSRGFIKVVILAEKGEAAFETPWQNYMESTNLVFRCDECAAMTPKKNYYALVYFSAAPRDANSRLNLENERRQDFYRQSTAVLVNSGKTE